MFALFFGTNTPLINKFSFGIMAQTCNPSTQEAEAGGLQVQGQHWQLGETLSPNGF